MNLPFTPRLPPLPYQADYLRDHGRDPSWGLFFDQGTGKTKAMIDNAALLLCEDRIDGMLVIAPNGVERVWEKDELPKHWPYDTPVQYESFLFDTYKVGGVGYTKAWKDFLSRIRSPEDPNGPFGCLLMSYNGLLTDGGKQMSWDFLRKRRIFYVCDESQRFKEPSSKRNIRVYASSAYAAYKRIASGTPADSPFDFYSQLRFLDADFWKRTMGIESVISFRAHLGNWHKVTLNTGVKFDALNQKNPYKNLDELQAVLATTSTRLTEEQAELFLPPKVYKRVYHDLTPEQQQAWDELKDEALTVLNSGELVTAEHVLTLRVRLIQIGCGFITPFAGAESIPFKQNPRAEAVQGVLEALGPDEPTLGWGLFIHDCQALATASRAAGRVPVIYDAADPTHTLDRWKAGDAHDLIANLGSGLTEGHTLVRAAHALYYSNTPRLIARAQSEKRPHRIGQTRPVTYYDFLARGTNDEANLEMVRAKARWTGEALGDDPRRAARWLRATLLGDNPDWDALQKMSPKDPRRELHGEFDQPEMDFDAYEAAVRGLG